MAAGDLTNLSDLKAWSGIGNGGTAADSVLSRLITECSSWIATYTLRTNLAAVATFSEIRNGNGKQEMLLADRPVQSIVSLTIDQVAQVPQPADGQPGYFLIPNSSPFGVNVLALYGACFRRGRRNVRLTYTAGWSTPPPELAQCCIELVSSQYKRGSRDPLQDSVTAAGQETLHFRSDLVPTGIKLMLDAYKKVVPL